MKGFSLAALGGTVLLCACTSTGSAPDGQQTAMDRSEATVGSYIKRKPGSRADNVSTVDKQALENERTMGSGAINPPQR